MSDFEIKRSITEADIPTVGTYKSSKYDPVYTSCKTLEKGEGIEVDVPKAHVRQIIQIGLKKRFPNLFFQMACRRNRRGSFNLYIIRKS